jgi:chemotaxis protein CheX
MLAGKGAEPDRSGLSAGAEADMSDSTGKAEIFHRILLTNGITASVKKIFTSMISLGVWEMPPGSAALSDYSDGISALVGIYGTRTLIVGLHMGEPLAKEITAFMVGTSIEEVEDDREVYDAVGEITNVIAGDVKMILQKQLGDLHLSIPTVISGRDYVITTTGAAQCNIVVPFLCGNGSLAVSLCMTDGPVVAESGI